MASNLVIVESPAKCGKIKGFLGPDYNVVATMGHIRALEEDLAAIGLDRDFNLRYAFLKEKARAIAGLKAAAEAATTVYLAADDDREGEAIAYSVCVLLDLNPSTTPRAVFHEITKKAVTAAIANPRRLDMNRVNAQQARAALDMMIGFTISPLLWSHVSRGLSAGRCQTPALRIVVDREKEIESHRTESGWKMTGEWTVSGGGTLVPFRFDAALMDDLEDEESVRNYMENLIAAPTYTVMSAALSDWKQNAPLPFTTSTLQQAASSTLKSPPKKTMAAAQKLYEAGHITYMRTDSTSLSTEAVQAAHQIIRAKWGDEFCGEVKTAAAAAAHEAIRPTHFEVADDIPGDWTLTEKRLYKMIHLRAMQSTMSAMRGEQKTVEFVTDELRWRASWRRTVFAGWRKAGESASEGSESADEAAAEDERSWDAAIRIGKGDTITWETLHATPFETSAPKRYTEATLIKQLEKSGIGRPSTFASLVETIMDKKYVEKKDISGQEVDVRTLSLSRCGGGTVSATSKKRLVGGEKDKLVGTELGKQVLLFCLNHFDALFNYTFTANMEGRLDMIAAGTEEWKGVLRDTWGTYRDTYKRLLAGSDQKATKKIFSGGLVAIIRKSGEPLLLKEIPGAAKTDKPTFYGWPAGVTFEDMTEEVARAFVEGKGQVARPASPGEVLGHWNGQAVIKKTGKFGDYIVCGDVTASCGQNPTPETAIAKLEEKAGMKTRVIGGYELRQPANGGGYMFKKALKTKKFVSIPAGLDIMKLSAAEVEAIYKTGAGTVAEKVPATKSAKYRKKTGEVK